MALLNYSLDNLSLMALTLVCVGFVVDDRHRHARKHRAAHGEWRAGMEAALKGSKEIGFTIISMTLSLSAVSSRFCS